MRLRELSKFDTLEPGNTYRVEISFDLGGHHLSSVSRPRVLSQVATSFYADLYKQIGDKIEDLIQRDISIERAPGPLLLPTYRIGIDLEYVATASNPLISVGVVLAALASAPLWIKLVVGGGVALTVLWSTVFVIIPVGRAARDVVGVVGEVADDVGHWSRVAIPVAMVIGLIWLYRRV